MQLEPQHPWAYNNLAFLYNVHQYFKEAKIVCETAKFRFPHGNHNCYRHWAYAEYKLNNKSGEAFKKINLAVVEDPADVDSWLLWAMMLRTVGSYKQAQHKLDIAFKLDPDNATAQYEQQLLVGIMEMDAQLDIEQGPALRKLLPDHMGKVNY